MKCNLCNEELIWHDDYTETDIDENEWLCVIYECRNPKCKAFIEIKQIQNIN